LSPSPPPGVRKTYGVGRDNHLERPLVGVPLLELEAKALYRKVHVTKRQSTAEISD